MAGREDKGVAVSRANDRTQVRRAARRDADRLEQRRNRLLDVMRTESGRAVMWDEVLERCRVYESTFSTNAYVMAANAGRQDVGHEFMTELLKLDGGRLFVLMESEARARNAQEEAEREAFNTPRSEEAGQAERVDDESEDDG